MKHNSECTDNGPRTLICPEVSNLRKTYLMLRNQGVSKVRVLIHSRKLSTRKQIHPFIITVMHLYSKNYDCSSAMKTKISKSVDL
ncbi:hypothetical protein T12_12875 [Trichinella patagoniensis]|uniref:Uncharacterized protein n=1 Tax=Trichinella patagoniensis TaxID=990121 RepID=A0A0V0ZP63_9BILA|nr:hypothetical protein T12_12875 [Trichinella patagoniensis]